jgi:hypothetical protein
MKLLTFSKLILPGFGLLNRAICVNQDAGMPKLPRDPMSAATGKIVFIC